MTACTRNRKPWQTFSILTAGTTPPQLVEELDYRGTSLIRNNPLLAPYNRTIPRVLWWSYRGGAFLMSEVTLYLGLALVVFAYLLEHCPAGKRLASSSHDAGNLIVKITGVPHQ